MITSNCKLCNTKILRPGHKAAVFCNRACKSEYQRMQKPVDKEWLHQKYIVEGLGANEIAEIVKRDPKRVWGWLKDYGIPTRPRGSDPRQHFRTGHSLRKGIPHTQEVKDRIRQCRLQDGHVPYLKNGVHHLKGVPPELTPNWKGGITPERQHFYTLPEWKVAVKAVWHRDNATCQKCKLKHKDAKLQDLRFEIHHIVGFEVKELRCEVTNLILLCKPCHLFVHSKNNANKEFLKSA